MAGSSSVIAAADTTALTRGCPALWASRAPSSPADWRWTTTSNGFSGTSRNDASYPTRYAHDSHAHLSTRPSYQAVNTWYLNMIISADWAIDSFAIFNHTLGFQSTAIIGGTTGIIATLQLADNSDFSSGLVSVASCTIGISSLGTLRMFGLGTSRYSGYTYARLKLEQRDGANWSSGAPYTVPSLGEVVIGRRYQMPVRPVVGYDPYATRSNIIEGATKSGNPIRYTRYAGQRVLRPTFEFPTEGGLALLRSLYRESNWGGKKIVYLDSWSSGAADTASTAHRIYWGHLDPGGDYGAVPTGPYGSEASIEFIESTPFWTIETSQY